ncbi:hypothetical protein MTR67_037508, partial [Solanum verrucosum]
LPLGKRVHLINFLGCGIRSLLGNIVGGQEQIGVMMKIFDSFATFLPKHMENNVEMRDNILTCIVYKIL